MCANAGGWRKRAEVCPFVKVQGKRVESVYKCVCVNAGRQGVWKTCDCLWWLPHWPGLQGTDTEGCKWRSHDHVSVKWLPSSWILFMWPQGQPELWGPVLNPFVQCHHNFELSHNEWWWLKDYLCLSSWRRSGMTPGLSLSLKVAWFFFIHQTIILALYLFCHFHLIGRFWNPMIKLLWTQLSTLLKLELKRILSFTWQKLNGFPWH